MLPALGWSQEVAGKKAAPFLVNPSLHRGEMLPQKCVWKEGENVARKRVSRGFVKQAKLQVRQE